MAEVVQEKGRGLRFAEQQLLRHGWEHGKGLGRAENGISEAIKVKVKCDKGGIGHKEGEQFTFHWWDHVFNKASSSLQVESDQNGIQLKKTADEDEEDTMISNKKPRQASLAKAKLYGCFVKSATLLSGQEQPEPKSSDSDDSSSSEEEEEEDQKLDLSSTIMLSDSDLMKVCGGRTAHKGARHGLTMSAKLARLEQQEAEFMAKYGKKSQPASAVCITPSPPTSQSSSPEVQEQMDEDSQRKKMKKKKSTGSINEPNGDEVSESPEKDVKPKKKKKKTKKASEDTEEITNALSTEGDVICIEDGEADHSCKTKRKRQKKNKNAELNEEERAASPAAESPEETAELQTDTNVRKKKKKKKSSKHHSEPAEAEKSNDTESSQLESVQHCVPKTKKKKSAALLEEAEVTQEETTVKQKRKKCKKDKSSIDDSTNEEALPPKKKKKKSKE
ncbi:G patch domain-containing protein 4 [Morone saxatilis]|uniref:G patch domain-containing protein 4 n=1 Tax=Morone saxatilis TaxID=34816 RepID=UPI0015E1D802|nr:G patch domain-containing protein 4 [Morone saxatilis]